MDLYKQAMTVAETFDVSSPENSVVLYSISYLPTTHNRDLAFDCVRSNPGKMMIEHTACGAELVRLGLDSQINAICRQNRLPPSGSGFQKVY